MQYQNSDKPVRDIARELGVDALIEGSLERTGDNLRIRAQLIDGRTEEPLWTQSFDGDLRNIVGLERQVTRAIVDEIELALTPEAETRLARARPVNPEAYEAYLKGQFNAGKLTPPDLETALQYYGLALDKDPDYALAHAGIALNWAFRQQMGIVPPSEAAPQAREAVARALELDSTLVEVQYALAVVRTWVDWDWEGAEPAYRRAIELNPNFPDVRAYYSHFLSIMGRPDEAIEQIERALELDPFNALFRSLYGQTLMYLDRYDDAIVQFQNAQNHPLALSGLRSTYHAKGMYEEAIAVRKAQSSPELVEALDRGYMEGGYQGAMLSAAEMLAARSRTTDVRPRTIAALYAASVEPDQAFDWLERAMEERDPNMPYLNVFPMFDGLHDDPRWQDLLRRMGLPE